MWWGRRRPPRGVDGVEWRELGAAERDAVVDLSEVCAVADGARRAEPTGGWVGMDRCVGVGGFAGGQLVAAVTVRSWLQRPTVEGYVHPAWRGRGLGGAILDWGLARGGGAHADVETGVLTAGAQLLFESRGLRLVAAMERLSRPVGRAVEVAPVPAGITFAEWDADDGYDVYAEAFADRPDNPFAYLETPGQTRMAWRGVVETQGRVQEWSLLARDAEGWAVGLVVCDDDGPFHFGTVPDWRGRGLGLAMVTEAISRVPADPGRTDPWQLAVNTENTAAVRLLRRAGYESDGREGHFRPHR
ncbi:GNAT family N-acetyltransferase [Dactylosporangium sp. NPDC051541]|uniref:GNAT family N-acetyltransferase n=1 Tax=Dactylosporangium sp. NPDC051541 TaxID=3363977 RepID=UPI00379BA90E